MICLIIKVIYLKNHQFCFLFHLIKFISCIFAGYI